MEPIGDDDEESVVTARLAVESKVWLCSCQSTCHSRSYESHGKITTFTTSSACLVVHLQLLQLSRWTQWHELTFWYSLVVYLHESVYNDVRVDPVDRGRSSVSLESNHLLADTCMYRVTCGHARAIVS